MDNNHNNETQRLFSTFEAAIWIGMSEHWLKTSRFRPELDGPPFIKVGRRTVRYDVRDLNTWLEQRRYRGTHEIYVRRAEQ